MTDIGEEHQSRVCEFHHFVVQPLQLLVLAGELFVEAGFHNVASEYHHGSYHDEEKHYDGACQQPLLCLIVGQIAIHLLVQAVQVVVLAHALSGLHECQFGIVPCDERCLQEVVMLISFSPQYLHGQRYHLLTLGGVEVGGLQDAVAHHLQSASLVGHTIHSCVSEAVLESHLLCCLGGSECHAVIVTIDEIEILGALQDAHHGFVAAFLLPVSSLGSHQLHLWISLQRIHKSAVSVDGRR